MAISATLLIAGAVNTTIILKSSKKTPKDTKAPKSKGLKSKLSNLLSYLSANKQLVISIAVAAVSGIFLLSLVFIRLTNADEPPLPPMYGPGLEIDPDSETYDISPGDSVWLDFGAFATDLDTGQVHEISVISDNSNGNIVLSIEGGDLSGEELVPSSAASDPALVIKEILPATHDTYDSDYTLYLDTLPALAPGSYTITLTYDLYVTGQEFFMFTIDTRMTNTLDTSPTHYSGTATTFSVPTSGYVGGASNHTYSWIVDWGDGSSLQNATSTSSTTSTGISHDYASSNGAGEYTITILSNGVATNGWFNAFGFYSNTNGANAQSNKNMFKSIDSPFTNLMRTENATYEFKLDPNNRWVKRAKVVPWELAEEKYQGHFSGGEGRLAKPARMALGALIIQQTKGCSDEETLLEITENPYLQYFIGMKEFRNEPPFDSSRPAKAGLGECSLFGRILTHGSLP